MICPTANTAARDYRLVLDLLDKLGLDVANKKLQPPAQSVTWLGVEIDILANRLALPHAKLDQIKSCMAAASRRTYINTRHMQRLIGLANHLAKITRAARIFICRLLAALRAATSDAIRISKEVKADLAWFARHLSHADGRAVIPHHRIVKRVWADACLVGAGASDGKQFYEYVFPPAFADQHHITHLEALNCVAAARTFVGHDLAGGTVELMCDNKPAIDAFSSGRARDPVLAACTRALWFVAAAADVDFMFTHVPGEAMALPDALSRASIDADGRRRADALIKALDLRWVAPDSANFSYKSFT